MDGIKALLNTSTQVTGIRNPTLHVRDRTNFRSTELTQLVQVTSMQLLP